MPIYVCVFGVVRFFFSFKSPNLFLSYFLFVPPIYHADVRSSSHPATEGAKVN